MENLYQYELKVEQVQRGFQSALMKKDSPDFTNYIASLFNDLSGDTFITAGLSQLINKEVYLENELIDFYKDIYIIYNQYLMIFMEIEEASKNWKTLLKKEDPDDYIIPLSLRLSKKPSIHDADYLLHVFEKFEKFIEKHKLNKEIEEIYLAKNPMKLKIRNQNIFLEQILDGVTLQEVSILLNWENLKNLIRKLSMYNEQIKFIEQTNVKKYLIEILSYLKQFYYFYPNLKSVYMNNSVIEKYRNENRTLIVGGYIDKSDWEYKLIKIEESLINELNSSWSIDFSIKQYAMKIEQFNVTKVQKLIKTFGPSKLEKTLQLNLAEYLFDKGFKPIIEKQFYKDRLDILTTTKGDQVIEVKVFKNLESLIDIFQGFVQTDKYMKQHLTNTGYYVIFADCESHKINCTPVYSNDSKAINTYIIDISQFSGRTDEREEVNISEKDIHDFMRNKETRINHSFQTASLADLLSVNGLGGKLAYDIFKRKNSISSSSKLLEIPGIGPRIKSILETNFKFDD